MNFWPLMVPSARALDTPTVGSPPELTFQRPVVPKFTSALLTMTLPLAVVSWLALMPKPKLLP